MAMHEFSARTDGFREVSLSNVMSGSHGSHHPPPAAGDNTGTSRQMAAAIFPGYHALLLSYEMHIENAAAVSPHKMPPTPTPICRRRNFHDIWYQPCHQLIFSLFLVTGSWQLAA